MGSWNDPNAEPFEYYGNLGNMGFAGDLIQYILDPRGLQLTLRANFTNPNHELYNPDNDESMWDDSIIGSGEEGLSNWSW